MKKTALFVAILTTAALLCAGAVLAEGTNSAMGGTITDADGSPLPGAMVTARHLPTNARYSIITNANGTFTLRMLRVGGPYTVTVSMPGFQDAVLDNIMLSLGVSRTLNFKLQLESGD